MGIGDILLWSAFVAAMASAAFFAPTLRGKQVGNLPAWLYGAHTALLVGAMVLLGSYFFGHRYEFAYVAQYGSRELSPSLTLAASWAGQEGSILLWLALGALVGLAMLRQPGPLKAPAMFFICMTQAALSVLVLARSPFRLGETVPADGQGLNPLLQDPWMVAHPPALFIGYAAMLAPFALAAAALARQDYKEWLRVVWPWALFALVTLGIGIAMGGVWAFKVLGWGGYWGWDPVENASLIPWLMSVALVHGLLIQRATGSAARTNLLISLVGWTTVLGGTYLTRSGVLQDISVHSFSDSGLRIPLLLVLTISTAAAALLLRARWGSIEQGSASMTHVTRSSALWMGLVTVVVLAGLVSLGTITPLLTRMFGAPASVQNGFYTAVSLPLAVAMTLLMALGPALRWSSDRAQSPWSALLPGAVVGVVVTVVAYMRGVHDPGRLLLALAAGLALGVNAVTAVRLFRRGWSYGSGYLGHFGIAVMVLGMVASGSLGRSERVRLVPGTPSKALGYTLTYSGMQTSAKGGQQLSIRVQGNNWFMDARPELFASPRGEGTMRKPAISMAHDLYVSPVDIEQAAAGGDAEGGATWLTKGQEVTISGVGYKFLGFRMTSHEAMQVLADVEVRQGSTVTTVSPGIKIDKGGKRPMDAEIPGGGVVSVARIDADNGRVAMALPGSAPAAPAAIIELSTKPFINLVWLGALVALLGTGLAGMRRAAVKMSGRAA